MYRFKSYFIAIIFLTLVQQFSWAQGTIRFQNTTVADGLSMGTITEVVKDQSGFVWIATAEGLHRFDGTYFMIFKHEDGVESSLSDSYISCLATHGNQLFIGNNSGMLDVMDLEDYTISSLDLQSFDAQFDFPISKMEVYGDMLLVGTDGGGLWVYDLSTQRMSKYQVPGHQPLAISDIEVYGQHFYLSAENQVFKCDLQHCNLELSWERGPITTIAFYHGQLLVGGGRGLQRRLANGDLQDMPYPDRKRRVKDVTDLVANGDELWVASMGGLSRHSPQGLEHYMRNDVRPYSLVNDEVKNLYMDNSGTLWIGTLSGLSRYSPRLRKFGILQYFDFEGKGYNNNVYYVFEDKDQSIWLGTLSSGLIKLNQNNQIVDLFPVIKDGAIVTRAVRCIFRDASGVMWIGTRDEGLFRMDETNRRFVHVKGQKGFELRNRVIRCIYEDKIGRMWLGTEDGLYYYDRDADHFFIYQAEPQSNTNNTIYQITEDPKTSQLILASFRGGLQLFSPRSKHFVSLKYNQDDSTSISNNNVMCLEWLNEDTLLLGTYGGGMNILDLRTKKSSHITERNGLPNNAVYGILYYGQGETWLSTNNGLVKYHIYNREITHFKPVHYLQSTEFNEGAFRRSSNGFFYFGGVNGLNYFKPLEISYDTVAPPLKITAIRGAYDKKKKSIALSFLNTRLELDFMALYYVNPKGVRYRYKMEGYDHDWVVPTISNTAAYPRLSPGHYTFNVMAEDEFGRWSSEPVELAVYVSPPFWQKWWFIALILAALSGGIYALFRFRTREIERSYKLQLVDSELRALRSQMNPHFIFNSLNSIQYFILKKQPQEAYTYLSKFASLMRKILQNSRLKYISIQDEMEWLELYLEMEKMRMDDSLIFEIDCSDIEDMDHTYIPTMLIQPYVENSIIHGLLPKALDRRITIRFIKRRDHLECQVEDNGIGRKASRIMNEKRTSKHNSAGMALTKSRLKILSEGKGDFDVSIQDLNEAGKATGTLVTIQIPLINKPV